MQIVEWETLEDMNTDRSPLMTERGEAQGVDLVDAVADAVRFLLANERAGGEGSGGTHSMTSRPVRDLVRGTT